MICHPKSKIQNLKSYGDSAQGELIYKLILVATAAFAFMLHWADP